MKTIACAAGYGSGGLGQHLAEIVEEARQADTLACYYTQSPQPDDPAGRIVSLVGLSQALQYTPLRFSLGGKNHVGNEWFDRAVTSRLDRGETYMGFVGQSLHSFRQARCLGYEKLELEAANSHVRNVTRQHTKAFRQYGIETQSWLNEAQCRKTEREYEMADEIVVASEYSRQSFLAAGFPASKLRMRRLVPHARFQPPASRPDDGVFRIVCVGSMTVMKGIPVLLEAFSRLSGRAVELTLVGGWASRGMRRFLLEQVAKDTRIHLAPGDPLPHLQRANVYVHPTYEDGFAYSAAEALACGVPVIVTEDTGMKELVEEGVNGYIVPTGSWEAILERLEFIGNSSQKGFNDYGNYCSIPTGQTGSNGVQN